MHRRVRARRRRRRPEPRCPDSQASSREIVASAAPLNAAARSRTQVKNECGRLRRTTWVASCQVTLMLSHSSVEITSRERRATAKERDDKEAALDTSQRRLAQVERLLNYAWLEGQDPTGQDYTSSRAFLAASGFSELTRTKRGWTRTPHQQ